MDVTTKPAIISDAVTIGFDLRPGDEAELRASRIQHPAATVVESLLNSEEVFTVHTPDGPTSIWGYARVDETVGIPWMVARPCVKKYLKALVRHSRAFVDYMQARCPVLTNYVDTRHSESISYLRFLGFKFIREVTWGEAQIPFYEFTRIRKETEDV